MPRWSLVPIALSLALVAGLAVAQSEPRPIHHQTSPPAGARFEVLQSTIAARFTYRLDRYTGRIWQLVRTSKDENAWEEMDVTGLPRSSSATRPRFQLITSGIAARHTFLLDTDTGKSWVVVLVNRKAADGTEVEVTVWQPFAE